MGALYLYYLVQDPEQIKTAQIRFRQFLFPALCDFLENTLLVFGLLQVFPSVSSMTRALVVPLTAWIGKYLVRQRLSWNQIYAMTLAIGGVFLGALVQL